MFEVGFTEIVLILGLALLVLGPEKLPGLAEKVGRWTGRARAMARQLRTQLEHEVTLEELARSKPMQASKPEDPNASADTSAADTSGESAADMDGTSATTADSGSEASGAERADAEPHSHDASTTKPAQ